MRIIYQGPEEQQEFSFLQPSVQPPGRGGRRGQINNRAPKAGEKETLEMKDISRFFFYSLVDSKPLTRLWLQSFLFVCFLLIRLLIYYKRI